MKADQREKKRIAQIPEHILYWWFNKFDYSMRCSFFCWRKIRIRIPLKYHKMPSREIQCVWMLYAYFFLLFEKNELQKKRTHKSWMRRQYLIATKCDMSKWIGNKVSFEFDPLDLYSTSANSSSVFKCSNGASESQYNF